MQLSKNFYLEEFLKSQTASRLKLNNNPNEKIIANLKNLAIHVLQPIREHYDRPVVISSGYRSVSVNRAIGSHDGSQHVVGQAADFEIPGLANLEVAKWIRDNLTFDQLILEFWTGGNSGWIHCSYRAGNNRKQTLTINNRGTHQGFKA